MELTILAIASSILALLFAGYIVLDLRKQGNGTERMMEISGAVRAGSMAYLKRQFSTIGVFALIIFIIILLTLGWQTGVAFLVGALFSALAGYVGMSVSSMTNVKVANAARTSLEKAFRLSFRGGAVTGMFVVGLSLLGISGFYLSFSAISPDAELITIINYIIGFGFGASLISLFARVGGGIFTKAADVGADLVGKVEAGIPEDDPRNPAVIADNVGDNVGDCAGMGADLFESYAVTAIAAMLLGVIMFKDALEFAVYPMILGAAGIVASVIGVMFVKGVKENTIMRAMYKGLLVGYVIAAILFFFVTQYMFSTAAEIDYINLYLSSLVGLGVAFAIVFITEYYTAKKYRPVQEIAKSSQTGAATNIISGLAVGLESTFAPAMVICAGILLSYHFAGIYGVAIATMALLSVTGLIVAMDAYGPITDNAGGIAEMANLDPEVRKVTDALDSVGNTTKAVTKGFAIGSAALAALALFASFTQEVGRVIVEKGIEAKFGLPTGSGDLVFNLEDPALIVGLFIGGVLPFLFASFLMRAVGKAAFGVVNEVRRQFREIAGIMEGTAKPDYARCVDIVTKSALKEMTVPALLSVAAPILVGMLLGPMALGGLLMGCIATGLLLALMMTTAGGAWDNAKKFIEDGAYGGKGSDAHKAAVVGDTVGDPTKDTAGPAINPLIKVVNMIALLFIELIVVYGLTFA
ncbi:MAG: sodium-translocating pyrophosphatase [Candidatus Altiarchaeota archaeon]|nr:sodium-translocating pyrophosphatase [Candidatus Altiarchaeota archaeon]